MFKLYFLCLTLISPFLTSQIETKNDFKTDNLNAFISRWMFLPDIKNFPNFFNINKFRTKTSAYVKMSGPSTVQGVIILKQKKNGPLFIFGNLRGLPRKGKFGFHFHEFPIKNGDCKKAGGHFNPYGSTHGGKNSLTRHVGDLGNIISHYTRTAHIAIIDHLASLHGPFSVLGRSLVLHLYRDDLGKGGNEESLKTGNSGPRIACGTVVLSA